MRKRSRRWTCLIAAVCWVSVACGEDGGGAKKNPGDGGAGQAGSGGVGGFATGGSSGAADGSVDSGADAPNDGAVLDQSVDAPLDGAPLLTQPFVDTFKAKAVIGSLCTRTSDIRGDEPAAAGSYPLFIWTPGTGGTIDSPAAKALTAYMASRGFVAAAAEYSSLANVANMNCTQINNKAKCVYEPANADSAVSKLCARARSDCNAGIVVSGLSQGSLVAMLAKDYDKRVRAAYLLGAGNDQSTAQWDDMSACLNAGARSLPGDRVRAINGEQDGNWIPLQGQLESVTGNQCAPGSKQCFRANGSGWYVVADVQVQDGTADHCYHVVGGCSNNAALDSGYLAAQPWSMKPNLDWLAGFAD